MSRDASARRSVDARLATVSAVAPLARVAVYSDTAAMISSTAAATGRMVSIFRAGMAM
jgi:hypothetical protein